MLEKFWKRRERFGYRYQIWPLDRLPGGAAESVLSCDLCFPITESFLTVDHYGANLGYIDRYHKAIT